MFLAVIKITYLNTDCPTLQRRSQNICTVVPGLPHLNYHDCVHSDCGGPESDRDRDAVHEQVGGCSVGVQG